MDALETFHGRQTAIGPTDPYEFLVWWHCGYPASDVACEKGWTALRKDLGGIEPERLARTNPLRLAQALGAGGMIPERRAERLQEIATRVLEDCGGDLRTWLAGRPVAEARKALRQYPGIGGPGADRILLFGGIAPIAAVPSNVPNVLLRILIGNVAGMSYDRVYRQAQLILAQSTPEEFDARMRAYLLLKRHGQTLCKWNKPACEACPLQSDCAFSSKARA